MELSDIRRELPVSIEAEQSVIGSVLIDPDSLNLVADKLTAEDFSTEDHREIWLALKELYLQDKTIDVVTLIDMLVRRGVYASNEQGRTYIRVLAEIVPSSANIKDYATIVRDKSRLRQLITACNEITETAYTAQDDVSSILEQSEQKIFSIVQGTGSKDFVHIRDVLVSVYDGLRALSDDPESMKGTPTGFGDLDKVLIGLGDSDLVLVGARPGMGKTSFCLNIASNAAKKTGKAVAVFSLEMSCEQLVQRMLSSEGLIESGAMRSGKLSGEDWTRIAHAASALSECNIYIDDTPGITVTGMRAKLRRLKQKNLGLVVVDYLQLMNSDRKIDNRVQEVSDISRNMKLLAKELHVPVICCAQLSRATESRTEKIPMLSDLRDSGAIEQDADIVMFLYRPEYYENGKESKGGAVEPKLNVANVIIAKNRHGSTGTVELGWFGQYTKFTSISDVEEPSP